jgi:hypothetical protein
MPFEKNQMHGVCLMFSLLSRAAIQSFFFTSRAQPCAACSGASPPRECIYETLPRSQSAGGESKRRRLSRADPLAGVRGETPARVVSPTSQASSDAPSHPVPSTSSPSSRPPPPPQRQETAEHAEPVAQPASQSQQPAQALPARYPFFRYLGPTAIAPGQPFRRVSVGVTKSRSYHKRPRTGTTLSGPAPGDYRPPPSQFHPPTFPHAYATPTSAIRTPPVSTSTSANTSRSPSPPFPGLSIPDTLIDIFYEHMSSFLPFIRRSDLASQIARGTASEILLNIMAALAER